MPDILQTIVADKRIEVATRKSVVTSATLIQMAERVLDDPKRRRLSMREALSREGSSGIIAEFKRRSPSKGWIKEHARAADIPPAYARSGAAALSILTDTKYFGGGIADLRAARPLVPDTPILRKDFIVDEYQLLEARTVGADAVLLIAACLSKDEVRLLARLAHELDLETLLEIHDISETDHITDCIDMVGVNNRHLGTFHTDTMTSFLLAPQLPAGVVRVSESGISNPDTLRRLRAVGYSGFLIGESFMREDDPAAALRQYISLSR